MYDTQRNNLCMIALSVNKSVTPQACLLESNFVSSITGVQLPDTTLTLRKQTHLT